MTFSHDHGKGLQSSETLRLAWENYQAGRLSQAEKLCLTLLDATPPASEVQHLRVQICRQLDSQVRDSVKSFQLTPNPATIGKLRNVRRELVSYLNMQSSSSLAALWKTPFSTAHRMLMNSGLRDYLRTTDEDALFATLRSNLVVRKKDPADPALLLAVMLLSHCHELPPPENLPTVPDWLRETYMDFLLEMPEVHNKVGDADAYIDYLFQLVEIFHRICITGHGIAVDSVARELLTHFSTKANFIQAYFNTCNLRELYEKRGDIISAAVITSSGHPLIALPPRNAQDGRIRLGIFVANFNPKTETYFTLSHFEHLDRSRFHITLYAEHATGHPLEQHCIACSDRFVVLPQTNLGDRVKRIRIDDLDILLISTNMTGVTNTATLLGTCRMARIQISSVSSPVTTGCRHMDVMLSAEWNEPENDAADHYTEHLHLMPGSIDYFAYYHDKDPPTIKITRSNVGITDEQIVFFSGANYFKILPEVSGAWIKIMASVPGSVLILMPFNPNWLNQYQTMPFIERIQRQMADAGIDFNRLRILNRVPTRADLHKMLALADIYLDAYPFSGACSMLDPIIVGIPPITRSGPVGRSNHAASMLRMIGLEELITSTEHHFIEMAISMAENQALRHHIRDTLLGFRNLQVPPYFDTHLFSTRVGSALQDMYEQYNCRYSELHDLDGTTLRMRLQSLGDSVVGSNFEFSALTDIGIIHALIEPFFRNFYNNDTLHMVDVGACYGQMAVPLLDTGWTVDLFEPDPGARQILEKNLARFGVRSRIFASAVSNTSTETVSFHQSRSHGLSGLGDSPFAPTDNIIEVPCVRLADFYRQEQVDKIDFLKIDAEGYDFDVLESHDFSIIRPRLILIEYGTHFPHQTVSAVNKAIARMATTGYGSIIFNYTDDGNFQKGRWIYRMIDMFVDRPIPTERSSAFGNILFFLAEDSDFLLTLYALLESCRPRPQHG